MRLALPPFCIFSNPSTRQSKHLWTRRHRLPVVATSPIPSWLGSSVMYSAQQPSADNATINPAALSSPGKFYNSISFFSWSHILRKPSSTLIPCHTYVQVIISLALKVHDESICPALQLSRPATGGFKCEIGCATRHHRPSIQFKVQNANQPSLVIGLTQQPQRTLKRSHSPGVYGAPQLGDDGMSAISTPPLLYSFRHPTTLRQIRRSITIPF